MCTLHRPNSNHNNVCSGEIDFDEFCALMGSAQTADDEDGDGGQDEDIDGEEEDEGGEEGGEVSEASLQKRRRRAKTLAKTKSKGLLSMFKATVAQTATANASALTMEEVVEMLQNVKPEARKEWDLQVSFTILQIKS